SKKDIVADPGDYPIYSSAALNNGEFGRYGSFMFDEEMVTWSVDGGGHFFYRERHRFSVTNVGGWIRVLRPDKVRARYLHAALDLLHSRLTFDWTQKAHSSVIRRVYSAVLIPQIYEQDRFVQAADLADRNRADLGAHLAQLDTLFAALQQRAFRGEL
ncbi:restriction endonuclease subunit S, partial [bacterium]|nr:restriction endonuclease subunit S [bacterium]